MILLSISISVLVSLGACVFFAYTWRRRIRGGLETDAIMRKLRTEIGEMVTELNGTAERNIALLENQIRTISELTEKAGKVAAVLQREKDKHDLADRVYTSLSRSKPLTLNVEESSIPEKPAGNTVVIEPEAADFDTLPVREKALILHRKGNSLDSIAGELDLSRGEVELIISLHDRRN